MFSLLFPAILFYNLPGKGSNRLFSPFQNC